VPRNVWLCDADLQSETARNAEEHVVAGTEDEIVGKAKEAVADLTDDDELKREGKADQAAGSIKEKLGDAKDWVEERVDDVKDKLHRD
jgi:uncharacterized protein YjbJ (UPF0337 family)